MTERYRYSLIRRGEFDRICKENHGEELMRSILLTEEERDRMTAAIELRKEKLEFETAALAKFTIPLFDDSEVVLQKS